MIFALLPFELDAIARARTVEVRGSRVRFCTPEDLILHKIVSHRERDRGDVEGLIETRRADLDRDYLDPRIEELAQALDQPQILARYRRLID